jgi:hypothetical protein
MPQTIRGIQPLSWGTIVTTGYVTESTSETEKTEEATIVNESGDVVTQIVGFGKMTDVTLEVIPKNDVGTPPAPGDVFTYGTRKIVILSIDKKTTSRDVEKWSIKGNRYPDISLT